eukprot:1159441-Pelagomonas_calceolata.AAC.12
MDLLFYLDLHVLNSDGPVKTTCDWRLQDLALCPLWTPWLTPYTYQSFQLYALPLQSLVLVVQSGIPIKLHLKHHVAPDQGVHTP